MSESRAAVVGAGTMGNGIAQAFAAAGFEVRLLDIAEPFLTRAMATIERNLGRQVKRGAVSEDEAAAAFRRIRPGTGLGEASDAEFVVEAIVEDEAKQARAPCGAGPAPSPRDDPRHEHPPRFRSLGSAPPRGGRTASSACIS